jgi:hypothetical protein
MRKLRLQRPSASLVISIVALVIAAAGTATAATSLLITSSKQVRAGSLNGTDIQKGTIKGSNIADNTLSASKLVDTVRSSLGGGASALEAVRKAGPEAQKAGAVTTVATLSALAPGTYAIFAKTILSPDTTDLGLLGELLKNTKTSAGHCVLDAGGDVDHSRAPVATPYTATPTTLTMQMTRTIAQPTDILLTCDVNDVPWRASDTSIIAMKLASSSRSDVGG